jgi:hypothetical protein
LKHKISCRYDIKECPSNALFSALIFGDLVQVGDAEVRHSIKSSLVTNSFTYFFLGKLFKLIILWTATSEFEGGIGKAVANGVEKIVESIAKISPKEDLRAICYYEWMKIRIEVVRNHNSYSDDPHNNHSGDNGISIAKLLGILDWEIIPDEYRELFLSPLCPYDKDKPFEFQLSKNSYENIQEVRQDILGIDVCHRNPVAFILPAEKEAWNLCLKIYTGDGKPPMHVYIQNKCADENYESDLKEFCTWEDIGRSRNLCTWDNIKNSNFLGRIDGEVENIPTINRLHDNGRQYRQAKEMMQAIDLVYIYFKTHNVESFYAENAIEMGRSESRNRLGPLYELYKVCRSLRIYLYI